MKLHILSSVVLLLTISSMSVAQESYMQGKRLAVGDYSAGKVCVIEGDGSISRTEPARETNDIWVMPGEVLYYTTGNGVKATDKTGKVLFEYNSKAQIYTVQPLENGNVFVGECTTGQLLILNPKGEIVQRTSLPNTNGGHLYIRCCRVLPNGNFLVTHNGQHKVVEYKPDGTAVWEFDTPAGPHSVARLSNGNTMIACDDAGYPCLIEVTPDKKIVWEFSNKDMDGNVLKFMSGFEKLPNGNYLVSNWIGHGKFGQAPLLFEITPEKKVVWKFEDHKNFRAISAVQVIDDTVGTKIVH